MKYLLAGRQFGKAKSAERAVSERLEIIRLVEECHLSAYQTLAKLGIPRTTLYGWYDRYLQCGEAGLQDQSHKPKHVWNRAPDEVKRKIANRALKETELSPRKLAMTFTDQGHYFVSESEVYRILKAHDLITSPAFIVIKATNEFKDKTTAINQLWQTDFTYLKVLGWDGYLDGPRQTLASLLHSLEWPVRLGAYKDSRCETGGPTDCMASCAANNQTEHSANIDNSE